MRISAFRLILITGLGLFPAASSACTLSLGSGGTLGLSLDGTMLGSTETGGEAASLGIVTGLLDKITISAPVLAAAPGAYQAASQTLEVAYQGQGVLSGTVQPFTSGTTQFSPGLLPLSFVDIHVRITNPVGFAAGPYAARVLVTCS